MPEDFDHTFIIDKNGGSLTNLNTFGEVFSSEAWQEIFLQG